ncbi:M20/M25/M40 family metallo-hydrolase [Paenibacillus qinlingensis]|uniref:M20/M25/M40 family metallo-hydrolase n=1 Tax=Paenibacillus qinlingensis TaxID=1837343 RepID=UPI001565D794|nr:M20/M25/M40 family metallo-hydrolase [Paenibacillus qinlingensis]NQX64243.1 M20/M25/M40 family metallo-hydrolase [Paenibacillus qinlingensis]
MRHTWSESIRIWLDKNKGIILDFVQDLVRFNTVNEVTHGSEKECQLFLAQYLRDMEMNVDVFSPEDVPRFREHEAFFPGKDYTDRPNVVAVMNGKGEGKSLLFSSHIDTTVAAPGWNRDPWTPEVSEGKLYGLGTFDMKGGLSASVMAVRCIRELGIQLQGDLWVESVVDEEFGGANGTLASRLKGYNPDAAIIPEPTNMAVCPGTRGGALWRVTFKGNTGMSFSGEKIMNPALMAAKFIVFLEAYEIAARDKAGPQPWFEEDRSLSVIVTRLEAGDLSAPLCDSGPTTCHVDIWVECHPHMTEKQLQQDLLTGFSQMYANSYSEWQEPEFTKMIRFLPGCEVDAGFPLIDMLAYHMEEVTGTAAIKAGAPFACDAFMFNLHSTTPAIVMGPSGGNAHAPDEYIDIPQFFQLIEIYVLTILNWCGIAEEGGQDE